MSLSQCYSTVFLQVEFVVKYKVKMYLIKRLKIKTEVI